MDKLTKKKELVETAIKTCIAIETSGGEFDGDRLTKQILRVLNELGVVIKDRHYGMGMDTRGGYNWRDVFFVIPLIKEESNGNNEVS